MNWSGTFRTLKADYESRLRASASKWRRQPDVDLVCPVELLSCEAVSASGRLNLFMQRAGPQSLNVSTV
jgi:hypothetical protein